VVIAKVPVVEPAATVAVEGTVTAALLEVRATDTPPVGAATFSVTVPVEPAPPATDVGATDTDETVGPVMARLVVAVRVPASGGVVAVIVDVAFVATAVVVTVNVADCEPAGTTTEVGTVAAAVLLDVSVTVTEPPVGTTAASLAVPVELVPPGTEVGLTVTVEMNGV
jgi:hypothetical protein